MELLDELAALRRPIAADELRTRRSCAAALAPQPHLRPLRQRHERQAWSLTDEMELLSPSCPPAARSPRRVEVEAVVLRSALLRLSPLPFAKSSEEWASMLNGRR